MTQLVNIEVTRIIGHEVVRSSQLDRDADPTMGTALLPCESRDIQKILSQRFITTLSSHSKCVDVEVETLDTFNRVTSMLDADDDSYINKSQELARHLSSVQTSGSIKSGSAFFIQGTCVYNQQESRFISIVKADPDEGIARQIRNNTLSWEYVQNLFLSSSQRMIKVAFFIENISPSNNNQSRNTEDFSIKVFDHCMSNASDKGAAEYFYRSFLGCKIASNAATKTKDFLDVTENFIMENTAILQKDKEKYRSGVIAILNSNEDIITPMGIAREVFPVELQSEYIRECERNEIATAFTKETSLIKRRLRKRSIKFSSNVTISAPTEMIDNYVRIENIEEDGWTRISIKGHMI